MADQGAARSTAGVEFPRQVRGRETVRAMRDQQTEIQLADGCVQHVAAFFAKRGTRVCHGFGSCRGWVSAAWVARRFPGLRAGDPTREVPRAARPRAADPTHCAPRPAARRPAARRCVAPSEASLPTRRALPTVPAT